MIPDDLKHDRTSFPEESPAVWRYICGYNDNNTLMPVILNPPPFRLLTTWLFFAQVVCRWWVSPLCMGDKIRRGFQAQSHVVILHNTCSMATCT